MKATPKNETSELDWSDAQLQSACLSAKQQKREIVDTPNKVWKLAIYINASPQRWEPFCNLQTDSPKLVPIQDAKTHWNPTFLMLQCAKRLQSISSTFCSEYGLGDLMLDVTARRRINGSTLRQLT